VVAVVKDGSTVGHCPGAFCSIFLRCNSEITCQVTGGRQYSLDLPQGGLGVPCKLAFHTNKKSDAEKTEKLLRKALSKNITDSFINMELSSCSIATISEPESFKCEGVESDSDEKLGNKNQKVCSKEVEDIIMGAELSNTYI